MRSDMTDHIHRHRPPDDGPRPAPRRARRLHHPAQPDGGLRDRPRRGDRRRRLPPARRRGRMRKCSRLQAAGDRAKGATAYVTLEPCAHTGRTGPCADALIAAGVARVVAAMRDPFPQVDGAGFDKLRAAGIAVESGLMEAQARQLNRGFLSRIERGRPWVRIKLATSLDGRTAMANGDSKWISGEASRLDVQRWRARAGAILTGSDTVLADDPSLTVRLGDDTAVRGRRCAWCWIRAWPRSRAARCAMVRRPRCTCTRRTPSRRAISTSSAPACRRRRGRLDLDAVLQAAGRARNQRSAGRSRRDPGRRACWLPAWSTSCCCTSRPVLLGERARPLFAGLGIDAMAQRAQLQVVDSRMIGDGPASAAAADRRGEGRIGMATFKDHFSQVAGAYAHWRPTYPDALFDAITAVVPATASVWEPGCGSGQATRGLSERFAHVHATEPSAAQIEQHWASDEQAGNVSLAVEPAKPPPCRIAVSTWSPSPRPCTGSTARGSSPNANACCGPAACWRHGLTRTWSSPTISQPRRMHSAPKSRRTGRPSGPKWTPATRTTRGRSRPCPRHRCG